MVKQKKNLKYKYKKKIVNFKPKALYIFKKVLQKKPYFTNNLFKELTSKIANNKIKYKITIRITPNNIFCTLKNLQKNTCVVTMSSGQSKIKISKKTLKFGNKILVQRFLYKIKNRIKQSTVLIDLSGPIKVKKAIIKQSTLFLRNTKLIIRTKELKCFNGCRPPKKRRKKQKSLRIFK
jgi:ribosomal protein S11